jgi:hypothetical protein
LNVKWCDLSPIGLVDAHLNFPSHLLELHHLQLVPLFKETKGLAYDFAG